MNQYYRDKSADPNNANLYSSSIITNIAINPQQQKTNVSRSTLITAIDNLNLTKSFIFKDDGYINFKKKVDKLNLKFYVETEKYLNNQNDMDRCQDQLFIILFKQISLYNEEVDRLYSVLKDYKQEFNKDEQGNDLKIDNAISLTNSLKTINKELERKVNEKSNEITKFKQEIDSLNRQNKFYKDKLQIELSNIDNTNVFNSVNLPKKNMSSDKVIFLNDNKELKDVSYKPTLSMNNFHKKNQKSTPFQATPGQTQGQSQGAQIQISSITEYFNSNSSNNNNITEDLRESTGKVVNTKKRNHSDNDPQSSFVGKSNKESIKSEVSKYTADTKQTPTINKKMTSSVKLELKKDVKVNKLRLNNTTCKLKPLIILLIHSRQYN